MSSHSDDSPTRDHLRDEITGLGEGSVRKVYYRELQQRIEELEQEIERRRHAKEELTRQTLELEGVIAARQQAEELLAIERDNARAIFEAAPVPLILVNGSCRVVAVNRAFVQMYSTDPSEVIGKVPGQLLDCAFVSPSSRMCGESEECSRCRLKSLVRGVITDGIPRLNVEVINRRRQQGGVVDQYLVLSLEPIVIDRVRHAVISLFDMTDRKRLEQQIAAERERLAVTLRSIGDGVIATDEAGRITLMNETAEHLTGWNGDEARGRFWREVFRIDEKNRPPRDIVAEVIVSNRMKSLSNNTILTSRDGETRPIADSVAPIRDGSGTVVGCVIVFRDMTEKYGMQDEILRRRKLDSLGVLAGGIAHDFNNLLTGIIGNVSLALSRCDDPALVEPLERSLAAAERSAHLTRQLLTFSKGGAPVKETVEIPRIVEEAARFMLRGGNVSLELSTEPDLPPCDVDPGQFSQVIENLVINARQAMPDGGVVRITIRKVEIPETTRRLESGTYLRIDVADQGGGIPEEIIPKIFDPYFTTKEKGSGLGLATVWSIVDRHGGVIEVSSRLGEGTTFSIFIKASARPVPRPADPSPHPSRHGGRRILVMDDEEVIRTFLQEMLGMIGHEVVVTRSGQEAVERFEQEMRGGGRFDLCLFDLTVPGGMGGNEAFRRIREIDPSVRGIVMSGYSIEGVIGRYEEHGFVAALPKPFTVHHLLKALEQSRAS